MCSWLRRCATSREIAGSINYFYSKTNQMNQCIKFILFEMTLYMFRTASPSIIRSSIPCIQQTAFACCCMHNLGLLMMDGETVGNM